jgi:hypothetical protein
MTNISRNNMQAIQWLARHAARKGHRINTCVIEKPEGKMLMEKQGAEGYNIKMDTNKNMWIGLIRLRRWTNGAVL